MKKNFRYVFESPLWTGKRQKKYSCPQCGKKSLVSYIDIRNGCRYIDDNVGKCDHEHRCGYHYTPYEYYNDHPWLKKPDWHNIPIIKESKPKRQDEVLLLLPKDDVAKFHAPISTFWQWMMRECKIKLQLSDVDLARVCDDYMIGSTREGDVIFWQIDEDGRVHTGHIMQYGPNGHRLRYQNWQHSILDKCGLLPKGWILHQCFFGQHLLKKYAEKQVCVVESEKTAVILAALQPEFVWLATGGSSGLSEGKLSCLKGRQVKVIPDSGCYEKWSKILFETDGIDYVITNQMEAYEPNTDLADIFLGEATIRNK